MASLLANDLGVAVQALFRERGRRHPEFVHFDTAVALASRKSLEMEEIAGAVRVILVEMSEQHDVEIVAVDGPKVLAQRGWKVDARVARIVRISHVGVIHQDLAAVLEVDAGAIRIVERVERQRCQVVLRAGSARPTRSCFVRAKTFPAGASACRSDDLVGWEGPAQDC